MKEKGRGVKNKERKQKHSSHDVSIIFARKFPQYVELQAILLLQKIIK